MSGYTRQVQTKLSDSSYYWLEELAHTRGVTVSELIRDLIEREIGRPTRITLAEQLAIELVLEVQALLQSFIAEFTKTDPASVDAMSSRIPEYARAEAERRIRDATDRGRTR